MTEYFSDRETGQVPRIKEEIDRSIWDGILSLINSRISDASLAYGFPSSCPDGNAIVGTNENDLWTRVRLEIPQLYEKGSHDFPRSPDTTDFLPPTPAILDLIEFIARYIAEPNQIDYHRFYRHHHLEFDREIGFQKFIEEINRIFSRNGLAYELKDVEGTGTIERLIPALMTDLIKRSDFASGNSELDNLLSVALTKFRSPKPEARQEAVEKLWDAFERLKTIEQGKDKKATADALIERVISDNGPYFKTVVEEEFMKMTKVGNEMRIRHSEVGKEPVGDNGEKDYLFIRLFSLIHLALRKAGRLRFSIH